MQTSPSKPSALIKPTIDTLFHIDYSWWEKSDEDLRTYLLSHLSPTQREWLNQNPENALVDFINPDTGEVTQHDELGLALQQAARDPDFINPHTSIVDCVFRVFIANGNTPQTPRELSEKIGRPATLILKTFGGTRIYKGIRPAQG